MQTSSSKVVVVTGGSRGIGLAVARAFVTGGANVVITGTTETSIAPAVRELESLSGGGTVIGQVGDVRSYEDVQRMVETVANRCGGIDVLVNNAGIGVFAPVAQMTPTQWHDIIETNLTGVFHCCHAALPYLRARGGGWIINMSSLSGTNPFADGAAYCASKAGLNAFSEALMQEVRQEGIRVAYVMPGSVNTGFSGRSSGSQEWKLAPEDVAQVVVSMVDYPSRSLPSRVEIRPTRPPRKS